YLYVSNVDSVFQRAVKAGGAKIMEPTDMFYGDRSGGVKDPSGNSWFIATHKEDIAPAELAKRAEAFIKQQKNKAALQTRLARPLQLIGGHFAGQSACSLYPKSGLLQCTRRCPLWANSGHHESSTT